MSQNTAKHQRLIIPSANDMYAAIENRDQAFDGVFFYGVVTTGVFCRPSCAARLANRENVRFFPDGESAVIAGFRPCKRCKPERQAHDAERMIGIARYISANADQKLTLATLAKRAQLSPSRFQKSFKAALGVSPKAYQDAARMARLKGALKDGDDITGAIFSAGYGSTSRVYGQTARNLGMTPSAYRSGGAGELIFYVSKNTSLGWLLLGATERGVCFAQFGESANGLLAQLKTEFPQATFKRSLSSEHRELDRWMEALEIHLNENGPRPDLPLDLRGTSLQLKVWRFLLSVEEGDVLSYGELASKIDNPKAVRAVASACGANKVGVLVPCHRVLRGNGELGGYRWGIERKRTILDIERRNRALSR